MEIYSSINTRVIDQEIDLRVLLNSLSGKSFAISPPIEVDNSFMMGLANDDLSEGICFRLPLSALSEVATVLFTGRDKDIPIYVHSLKQLINWFYRRNISIPAAGFRDVSIAAYLLRPPESDKGEDWQEFLLSSMVRDRLAQAYPFLPRQVEQAGYRAVLYNKLTEDACSVWELGKVLVPELQTDSLLYRLCCDVEMPLVSVLAEMERDGIGVDLLKIRQAWPRVEAACMLLCEQLTDAYGQTMNPFSESQVRDFLQQVCRIRLKKTDSVDDDLLKGLSARHRLIRKILSWRRLHRVIRFFK